MWTNTTEEETEASLSFKMSEGRYDFRSKSCEKGLGMSYMIGWFFCSRFRFRRQCEPALREFAINRYENADEMAPIIQWERKEINCISQFSRFVWIF